MAYGNQIEDKESAPPFNQQWMQQVMLKEQEDKESPLDFSKWTPTEDEKEATYELSVDIDDRDIWGKSSFNEQHDLDLFGEVITPQNQARRGDDLWGDSKTQQKLSVLQEVVSQMPEHFKELKNRDHSVWPVGRERSYGRRTGEDAAPSFDEVVNSIEPDLQEDLWKILRSYKSVAAEYEKSHSNSDAFGRVQHDLNQLVYYSDYLKKKRNKVRANPIKGDATEIRRSDGGGGEVLNQIMESLKSEERPIIQ